MRAYINIHNGTSSTLLWSLSHSRASLLSALVSALITIHSVRSLRNECLVICFFFLLVTFKYVSHVFQQIVEYVCVCYRFWSEKITFLLLLFFFFIAGFAVLFGLCVCVFFSTYALSFFGIDQIAGQFKN